MKCEVHGCESVATVHVTPARKREMHFCEHHAFLLGWLTRPNEACEVRQRPKVRMRIEELLGVTCVHVGGMEPGEMFRVFGFICVNAGNSRGLLFPQSKVDYDAYEKACFVLGEQFDLFEADEMVIERLVREFGTGPAT